MRLMCDVFFFAQNSSALRFSIRSEGSRETGVSGEIRIMSMNFERWQELAALASTEQDPAKLTELAKAMNLALTQKTPYLDPPAVVSSGVIQRRSP
jgi:hypothetical protein